MIVEASAVLGWCQRPGEFLESFWSEVHTGRPKRLGSDVNDEYTAAVTAAVAVVAMVEWW